MPKTEAKTVSEYLKALPPERRKALSEVRKVVLEHLPKGYEETIGWGMITYQVPLSIQPKTYNGKPLMYAALASQKNYMVLHLMCTYVDKKKDTWFRDQFKARGKKLDMGKGCLRFRKVEDLPLDLIGELIASTPIEEYAGGCAKA
jgi:uncharacterized protein YdhG (YjbR/CyaY superfamily)